MSVKEAYITGGAALHFIEIINRLKYHFSGLSLLKGGV